MDMKLAPNLSRVREQVSSANWQQRVNLAACYRLVAICVWDDLNCAHAPLP